MNHIETAILNCYGIQEAEQNMVFAARLTQRGHTIRNMEDLMDLYHQTYSKETVEHIEGLPHPTVQKFMVITVAVVGASRRFLTQITRHQNEVKYMSASLQYSNYSGHAAFAIPYDNVQVPQKLLPEPGFVGLLLLQYLLSNLRLWCILFLRAPIDPLHTFLHYISHCSFGIRLQPESFLIHTCFHLMGQPIL